MPAMNRSEERRWGRTTRLRGGALLRAARESAGVTAKEICRQTGMSVAQLSDIERGIGPLSLKRANQIANALKQPFVEIVQAILQDKLEEAGFAMHVKVCRDLDADGRPAQW
jgi:transcriptional regulator with XRE-family HTH domain